MTFLWTYFLFSAFLVFQVQSGYIMTVTFGEPQNYTGSCTHSLSWTDCLAFCLTNTTCFAIYEVDDDNCQVFTSGQITSAKRLTTGNRVAIKTITNSTTCPTELTKSTSSDGYYDSTTGTYRSHTTTYTDYLWTFNVSILKCPAGFTMFMRLRGPWCIGVVNAGQCVNKWDSETGCKSAFNGVISGLETVEEYEFVVGKARLIPSSPVTNYIYGFWVDGARKSTCMPKASKSATCDGTNEFSFSDPTLSANPKGYLWGTGQPDGIFWPGQKANCIVVQIMNKASMGMDDCSCSLPKVTPTKYNNVNICYQGYVCGRLPIQVL